MEVVVGNEEVEDADVKVEAEQESDPLRHAASGDEFLSKPSNFYIPQMEL